MLFQPASSQLKILSGTNLYLEVNDVDRNNYAEFQEIKTKTITVAGNKGDSKKAKLFITLKKSKDFDENMRKFNEIKQQNEEIAKKQEETKK